MVPHAFNHILRRQRQADLFEFKASLVYKPNPGYTEKPYLKKQNKHKTTTTIIKGGVMVHS